MKDDLSTQDYADMIAESWVNGQRKQAVEQFTRAVDDNCNPASLLDTLHDTLAMVDYHGLTRYLIVKAYNGERI